MQPLNVSSLNFSISNLSVSGYLDAVSLLFYSVVAIVIYALFIFKFYRFVGRRDILNLKLHKYADNFSGWISKFFEFCLIFFEYVILTPVFVLFWFCIMASLLIFLAKTHSPALIVFTSVSLISAIRVCAYISEDLSKDLAKMIPFALLGVFIVDISYFDLSSSFLFVGQALEQVSTLVYFLGFIVVLEMTLRLFRLLLFPFAKDSDEDEN